MKHALPTTEHAPSRRRFLLSSAALPWPLPALAGPAAGGVRVRGHIREPVLTLARDHRLELVNDTAWDHPIHLHGHSFRVLSRNGRPTVHREWQDTVLMAPSTATCTQSPSPGAWQGVRRSGIARGLCSSRTTQSRRRERGSLRAGRAAAGALLRAFAVEPPRPQARVAPRRLCGPLSAPHDAVAVLTVEIAWVADNPGDWMFHCHILEHQIGGMTAVIRVA